MLVDDNDTDNFISKRIIEITKFANRVEVKNSGKSALDYLRENYKPDRIAYPFLVCDDKFVVGYDPNMYEELMKDGGK